jgi:hypothetical protein
LGALGAGAWLGFDWLQEHRIERQADAYVDEMVAISGLADIPDFHRRVDGVRTFINDNSDHNVDAEFRANQGNPSAFASGVLAYAEGRGEPAHMECSTRSSLMARILDTLGYKTRRVSIFDSHRDEKSLFVLKRSHTFLDVLNPVTNQWETQDADYDIYWRRKSDGKRVSVVDAADKLDNIEPCGRTACGWQHVSREGIGADKLAELLDIISVTDKDRGLRFSVYTSRTNVGQVYTKGSKRGTFCKVEAKRCRHGFFNARDYEAKAP